MADHTSAVSNAIALSSLLDRIDSTTMQKEKPAFSNPPTKSAVEAETENASILTVTPSNCQSGIQPMIVWQEYIDPASRKSYFYNSVTKETSWDKPEQYIPAEVPAGSGRDDYRAVALFGAQNGRFTQGKGHLFDETGKPIDRSLRQLAHFVDIGELEQNRQEAVRKKHEVAKVMKGTDWKAFNKQKKEEKVRKKMQWMLDD